MYERILVGTDGSPTATRAVEAAAMTAVAHGAELTVAHAFTAKRADIHAAMAADVLEEYRWMMTPGAMAEAVADSAVRRAMAVAGDRIVVRAHCELGRPTRVLLRLIDDLAVDAVVVGNRDMQGRRVVRRGIGHTLSRRASCDVVIVDTVHRRRAGAAPMMRPALRPI